jgi:hypothetical protein
MTRKLYFVLLMAALAAGLMVWAGCGGPIEEGEEGEEPEAESAEESSAQVLRTPEGDPVVKVEPAAQTLAGIRSELLSAQSLQPEIVAYGRLEEDPSHSFVLRAPITGILHSDSAGKWPAIGGKIIPGAAIGTIEPRFAPAERISLTSQLTMARAELNGSMAAENSARAAYERARILNADNRNVSDRVLQEAEARLKEQEERIKAARENVKLLEDSLGAAGPGGPMPLVAERGGDAVEIMAQPGEVIESGAPILRISRLDQLLARIDLPAGQRVPSDTLSARIVPAGFEDQPLRATRAALAPEADLRTQGQPFYFRLLEVPFGLRPGHAVTAYLSLSGTPRQGVIVPRSALVRMDGKAYAYVQISANQFARRLVALDEPVAGGYFTVAGISPGDKVIAIGAQTLLSEEFKSQIATEDSD